MGGKGPSVRVSWLGLRRRRSAFLPFPLPLRAFGLFGHELISSLGLLLHFGGGIDQLLCSWTRTASG
jgi:hypothetical protein